MKKVLLAAAVALLAVVACSKDSSDKKKGGPKEQKSEAVIPVAGGIVDLGGEVSLDVPGGAVEQDQNISLTFTRDAGTIGGSEYAGPAGSDLKLPGDPLARMVFGPEGLEFGEQITVSFPCTLPQEQVDVLYYNAATGQWVSQGPVIVQGGKGSFQIKHFSTYIAVRLSMAPMSSVGSYVLQGLGNGSSADEIAGSFHEWVINGNGRNLMNRPYKNPGNGLYYEPFYSFCSVAWCVYAGGIESNPDVSGLHEMGVRQSDASFCGVLQLASYFSGYDSSEQLKSVINGTTVEEKRSSQMQLFDSMVEIFYRLAKPDISLSPDKTLSQKGDEATVTLEAKLLDRAQGDYIPVDGIELEISSSDASVVSVSKSKVTTDSEGKATFKIKALKDEGSSTISARYVKTGRLWSGGPDDYVEAVKTLDVSLGEIWEMEFSCNYSNKSTATVSETVWEDPRCNCPEQSFACEMTGSARFSVAYKKGKAGDILAGAMPASYYAGHENEQMEAYVIRGKANVSVPASSVSLSFPEVTSSYKYEFDGNYYTISERASYSVNYHLQPTVDIEFAQVVETLDRGILIYFVSPFDTGGILSDKGYYKEKSVLYFDGSASYTKTDSENGHTESDTDQMVQDGYYLFFMVPNMLAISLTEGTFPLTGYPENSVMEGGNIQDIMFSTSPHYNYIFLDALPIGHYFSCVELDREYHPQTSGSITLRKAAKNE